MGQNDFEGSSCFLSSLRLLRDGAAVEDNLQGENGEEFSQNGPSYTLIIRDEMRSVDEYFNRSLIILSVRFLNFRILNNSSFLLVIPAAF